MSLSKAPLRELLANAEVLAESLEHDRRPQSAALIRELVARVVPMKVVSSGGSHPRKFVLEDTPLVAPAKLGSWCSQCDKLVTPKEAATCKSRFCKVQP